VGSGQIPLVGSRGNNKIKTPTSGISEQQEESGMIFLIFPTLPFL
jgi:hypothetical protein